MENNKLILTSYYKLKQLYGYTTGQHSQSSLFSFFFFKYILRFPLYCFIVFPHSSIEL